MSQSGVKPSIFGGTMVIAGTAIGAGMLALPTISAGMWSFWAIALIFVSWGTTYLSSRAILEVNLHYTPGASFNSLVKDTLGPIWNSINGFSYAFVLYIVLYAYVSGGGSTVDNYLVSSLNMSSNPVFSGLLFSSLLIAIVFIGAKAVDRMASIMMIGLVVAFIASMSGMTLSISPSNLFDQSPDNKTVFIGIAVSTYLTSFAFHNCVPSLVKYFGKEDPLRISKCLLYGSLMALVVYMLWIILIHGNISRDTFKLIIAEGGNVGTLLKYAGAGSLSTWTSKFLDMFAFLALTTSFLGVGLGLYDYIVDLFKFDDSVLSGKIKTTVITFILPVVGGVFFPNGFISAIAWAGLFSAIWVLIIPAMMLMKVRTRDHNVTYVAYKGNAFSYVLIIYGVIVGVVHILSDVLRVLPVFK